MNKRYNRYLFLFALSLQLLVPIVAGASNFSKEEFASRREKLMNQMDNAMAIFKGGNLKLRNGDVHYGFRQASDFYYLTGYVEPGAAFLLPEDDYQFVLFVKQKGFGQELFGGKQRSREELMKFYGADTVFYMNEFNDEFINCLSGKEKIYYNPIDRDFDDKIYSMLDSLIGLDPAQIIDPSPLIHEMRLLKSPYEIKLLQKSIDITCDAHIEAMSRTQPRMNEYEINAIVNYVYQSNGSERWGFPSIIASGLNSTILHYDKNNSEMFNGDLIMLDIGAEYGYYAADVTRTFPVNGKFAKEQKDIYEIALRATSEAVNMVAPGVGFKEVHNKSVEVINEGLFNLGLITDKESPWQYRIWFMYWSMHWLGLDVHDVGDAKFEDPKGRILEPGMVIAIEPGIYINKQIFEDLPEISTRFMPFITEEQLKTFMDRVRPAVEKYANICCRVEDDVLVTENEVINLSSKAPREIEEIEKIMSKKSWLND